MSLTVRRILIILVGALIIFGATRISKKMSNSKTPPERKAIPKQEKVAEIMRATNSVIPTTLEVQGSLVAFDKIDIFTEVSGTLKETAHPFKVGSFFPKGSVLIRVDDTEAKLNLLSQKSNLLNSITQLMPDLKIDYNESFQHWKNYLDQFDVEAPINAFPEPLNDQEKYFIASRNLFGQYYSIKSLEERLNKYTVYAPFSGVLTAASINPGAVVRAGQKLGELMNTGNYELAVTVPLSNLKYIKKGNSVELTSDDIEGAWSGRIKRINDQVDAGTQTVAVFISVSGQNLREGMYLQGKVAAKSIENAVQIPRSLLVNQNAVYLVRDSVLDLKVVEVVKITEESAIVKGLENGAPLLREMITGAFDGMKVKVKEETGIDSKEVSDAAPGLNKE